MDMMVENCELCSGRVGTTSRGSSFDMELARSTCLTFLQAQVKAIMGQDLPLEQLGLATSVDGGQSAMRVELTPDTLTIFPFSIVRGMYTHMHTHTHTHTCTHTHTHMHTHTGACVPS